MGEQESSPALEFIDVHKEFRVGLRFKRVEAVRGVSLKVRRGEIFGYLGPNGAGKTTSMKMALGLIRATKGEIKVLGAPVWNAHARSEVGYAPEHPYFYDFLSPKELLRFYGKLFRMTRAEVDRRSDELLEVVGLSGDGGRRLRGFSKGMLQRVAIAQAMLNRPKLVILDEPLSGLDPMGRKEIRDVIANVRSQGTTVFLSSHILHDIETVCSRVAIVIKGKVERLGALEDLLKDDEGRVDVLVRRVKPEVLSALEASHGEALDLGRAQQLHVNERDVGDVLRAVLGAGGEVVQVSPHRVSLEELFVKEAGR